MLGEHKVLFLGTWYGWCSLARRCYWTQSPAFPNHCNAR